MAELFPVPMARKVLFFFMLFAAACAGAAVWSFRSGFLWTGICILAVAVPIIVLYWFMLVANPSRTRVMLDGAKLLVDAPPFFKASQPLDGASARMASLKSDPLLEGLESTSSMAYFGYVSGVFRTRDGREAVVVARGDRVLCLDTPERLFLLAPRDLDGFVTAVQAVVPVADV